MNEHPQVPQQTLSQAPSPQVRAPYKPPLVEPLGGWQTRTLQMSVPPVFPILGHALFETTDD